MRLWGGRFSEENDQRAADFTRSIELDRELAADDIAGSIAHVRGLGRAGLLTEDEVGELIGGLTGLGRDGRGRWPRMGPRARGRPPEPRVGAGRSRRWRGRQAAHRALAQRPGRHGPAALAAPGDRPTGRRAARLRAVARRAGRARGDRDPARDDAHPAGPAGAVRASPAGVRGDGRARPWSTRRCAATGQRLAARIGRARRGRVPTRSRDDGRRARVRRGDGQLDRCRGRSRLRGRVACRRRARDGAPEPVGGGDHVVVEPALWVHPRVRCLLDGLVDHAEQEESRSRRAGPRPIGPRHRRDDRRVDPAQGPAARHTSATSRRTRRRCSARSPRSRRAWACCRG